MPHAVTCMASTAILLLSFACSTVLKQVQPTAAHAQQAARLLGKLRAPMRQRLGQALLGCRLRLGARLSACLSARIGARSVHLGRKARSTRRDTLWGTLVVSAKLATTRPMPHKCVAVCRSLTLCRQRTLQRTVREQAAALHPTTAHMRELRACWAKPARSCASAAAKRGSALRTPRRRSAPRSSPTLSSSLAASPAKRASASAAPSAARATPASTPPGDPAAAALCRLPGLPSEGSPLSYALLPATSPAAARRLSALRRALAAGAAVAGAARSGSAALPPALPEARTTACTQSKFTFALQQ